MQIQLQTVLKLHVLILLALKTLYSNLSLKLHKYPYLQVSTETQRNCSDSDPQSVRSSNTPEIPKENSFYSGTRSSAVIDSRITDDKLSFAIKWEKRVYYSSYHASWFCRTCQEYSNSHGQYWKTVPRAHDQHPGVIFAEHENSQKHVRAATN